MTHPLDYSFDTTKGHVVIYPHTCLKLEVGILLKTTFVILELSFQILVCIHSDIHMKALIVIIMK